jgi:hypothetical protein
VVTAVCSAGVLWSLGQNGAGPPRDGSVVSCQLLDCIRKSDPRLSDDDLLTLTRWRGGRFKLSSAAVATSREDRRSLGSGPEVRHRRWGLGRQPDHPNGDGGGGDACGRGRLRW